MLLWQLIKNKMSKIDYPMRIWNKVHFRTFFYNLKMSIIIYSIHKLTILSKTIFLLCMGKNQYKLGTA